MLAGTALLLLFVACGSIETPPPQSGEQQSDSARAGGLQTPTMEERIRAVPEEIRDGLASRPDSFLPVLAAYLTEGVESETLRVKALHDWVCDNVQYDVAGLHSGRIGPQDPASVVRTGKSVCAGFSSLFELLCRHADIECVTIHGYGRGVGFDVFEVERDLAPNHDWNAVRIGGNWHLIDVTWDAGADSSGCYLKRYNLEFFLADPAKFMYTHFPGDPTWQLLPSVVPADEFVRLPYLPGLFFDFGLELHAPEARIDTTGEICEVRVSAPEDVFIMADILRRNGKVVKDRIEFARADGELSSTLVMPGNGQWLVRLFARRGSPYGTYVCVAELGVESVTRYP